MIEYDDHGHITAVTGAAGVQHSDGATGRFGRVSQKGHHVLEIDFREIDYDEVSRAHDFSGLRRLVSGYHIAGHPHAPELVKRPRNAD